MGKETVPFRMAAPGLAWVETLAAEQQITRSDVIRMALQYAKECDTDGRFTQYLERAIRQGRIRIEPREGA